MNSSRVHSKTNFLINAETDLYSAADENHEEVNILERWHQNKIQFWDDVSASQKYTLNQSPLSVKLTWSNICVKVVKQEDGLMYKVKNLFNENVGHNNPLKILNNAFRIEIECQNVNSLVFGIAQSGEVLAILGRSGSGKTMLLNALRKQKIKGLKMTGTVRVNGKALDHSLMKRLSAYVYQEDLFIGSLTVKEQLHFSAAMRMGRKFPYEERERRVQKAIRALGLGDCADTLIGTKGRIKGISGGEKKRLAFASEILLCPPILFCDEPTSGLDAFHALQIVQTLKEMAVTMKMTVLLTVHQPSSQMVQLFDQIMLMANGQLVFIGSASNAVSLWQRIGIPLPKNYNPADHFLKTMVVQDERQNAGVLVADKIREQFLSSSTGKSILDEASNRTDAILPQKLQESRILQSHLQHKYGSSYIMQLCALMYRSALASLRNPMVLKVRLCQTLLSAVIIGFVYSGTVLNQKTIMNYNGALFNLVASMNYLFQFAVIDVFCLEMPVFMREHENNLYQTSAYFVAKNIAELPQFTILPVLFTSIFYWMTGFVADFQAFMFSCLISFLMATVSVSIGYAVSCAFGKSSLAVSVLPALTIPAMAAAGFFINIETLPSYFKFLKYISYYRFAYESLVINQWMRVEGIPGCNTSMANLSSGTHCIETGVDALIAMGLDAQNFYSDIAGLVIEIVFFRLLALIFLYLRSR